MRVRYIQKTLCLLLTLPVLMLACGEDHDDLTSPTSSTPTGGPCKSSDECPAATPVCDELAEVCVQCLFDTQCDGGQVCEQKVCVDRTDCANSLDCVDQAPKTICDTTSTTCVECVQASDCEGDAECTDNHCEAYVACDTSLDCPTGQVCATTIGRCAQCEVKTDCPEGNECINNECKVVTACVSDNQCTSLGQLCDKTLGYCVDCLTDEQCPEVYHCAAGVCELDVCEAGATQCEGNAVVTCAESGAAWGTPVPCSSSTTCKSAGGSATCSTWVCTPDTTSCDGDVLETCSSDGLSVESSVDCAASGKHCFGGACSDKVCTAGASFCEGNEVRTCNATGSGSTVTDTCTASEYCDAATATCQTMVCQPGTPVCNGSVATVCNATGSGYAPGGTDCATQGTSCSAGACVTTPQGPCGWDATNSYYACGFQGADPSGTSPIACPPDLQVNGTCGSVTSTGCCDANGDNWYCNSFFLTKEVCGDPPPPTPGVVCGSSNCTTSQLCCFESSTAATCTSVGSTCAAGTPIYCDGPEDCAGQICCGESVGGASYNVVECRASCTDTDNLIVCNPQGANVCPSGKLCQASAVLTGYYVCK